MLDDLTSSSNKSLETFLYVLLGSLPILSSFTGCLRHTCFFVWQLAKSVHVCVWECGGVFQRMMVRGVCEYAHKQYAPFPATHVEQITS